MHIPILLVTLLGQIFPNLSPQLVPAYIWRARLRKVSSGGSFLHLSRSLRNHRFDLTGQSSQSPPSTDAAAGPREGLSRYSMAAYYLVITLLRWHSCSPFFDFVWSKTPLLLDFLRRKSDIWTSLNFFNFSSWPWFPVRLEPAIWVHKIQPIFWF